jgi:hypothetical protein
MLHPFTNSGPINVGPLVERRGCDENAARGLGGCGDTGFSAAVTKLCYSISLIICLFTPGRGHLHGLWALEMVLLADLSTNQEERRPTALSKFNDNFQAMVTVNLNCSRFTA